MLLQTLLVSSSFQQQSLSFVFCGKSGLYLVWTENLLYWFLPSNMNRAFLWAFMQPLPVSAPFLIICFQWLVRSVSGQEQRTSSPTPSHQTEMGLFSRPFLSLLPGFSPILIICLLKAHLSLGKNSYSSHSVQHYFSQWSRAKYVPCWSHPSTLKTDFYGFLQHISGLQLQFSLSASFSQSGLYLVENREPLVMVPQKWWDCLWAFFPSIFLGFNQSLLSASCAQSCLGNSV